ncbi:tRNA pseudouridine(55) synthase TruB [Piscinibacter sakaiensis]|uniref:tRNA pseudouridine(55) synthase TruB n=1 Tax=Piscinibacter sakaiensis TaxID=1547922 RepID=UPI001E3AADA8|nr:tRNA pseudouridine(55) synthase TruB [Piscinibacter sakaiensis]
MRAGRVRVVRRALHGVLLLDKPLGMSSNDALQRARWLLRAEKAGHTGTLDPLATGLLPLCFGAATKFSQLSLDADKRYLATLRLGQTTATGDAEGPVLRERVLPARGAALRALLEAACARFTGEIEQLPPMYSALKHGGRPLYEIARAGGEVERAPRRVTIHRLAVVPGAARPPAARHADVTPGSDTGAAIADDTLWTLDVTCSKGTYVRTLAEDLGEALGCGAHLAGLRRTASGPLTLDRALTLDALEALDEPAREARLLPVDVLLADRPLLRLGAEDAGRYLSGLRRRLPGHADEPLLRVYGPEPGAFLGSGRLRAGELVAQRLLSPDEVRALRDAAAAPADAGTPGATASPAPAAAGAAAPNPSHPALPVSEKARA